MGDEQEGQQQQQDVLAGSDPTFDQLIEAAFAGENDEQADGQDGTQSEGTEHPAPPAGGPATPEGAGQDAPSASAPTDDDVIEWEGRQLKRGEAKALVEFYDWARANPGAMQAFDAYLTGQYDLVPKGYVPQQQQQATGPIQQVQTEEVEDPYEDLPPAVRDKLSKIDEYEQRFAALDQQQQVEQLAVAQTAVQKGTANFQTKFGLTDEDIAELSETTARMGILPNIARERGDMLTAVEEALEVAYWRTPKFRDLAFQRQQTEAAEDLKRQQRASALSGASGSTPRGGTSPSNPSDRRVAMVNEITQAMRGGSIQD